MLTAAALTTAGAVGVLVGYVVCALMVANNSPVFDRFDVFFDGWRAGFKACREKMAQDAQVVAQLKAGAQKAKRAIDGVELRDLHLYQVISEN